MIKWESKIVLAKPEMTYGVDPTPNGAANAMLLKNVELKPMEGQDVSRDLERPFIGAQEEFSTGLYSMLTGSVELVGSGDTGVAPAWGPLMRACGVAEVVTPDDTPGDGSVVYSPISEDHESAGLHFYIGTTRHVLLGSRGTLDITVNAQGIPEGRFALTGLFATPTNQARPSVDLSNFQTPQIASKANTPTFTIGGTPFVLSQFGFSLGNDIQQRLLIGHEEIIIVDRAETISARVEAVPLGTFNPFADALALTKRALVLEHGTVAGKRVRIDAAQCALKRLSGYEQSQKILEWPLQLQPLPGEGDDQWSITLT